MARTIKGDLSVGRSITLGRITEAQRNSIFSGIGPADAGILIEVSDGSAPGLQRWTGTIWAPTSAPSKQLLSDGPTIVWDTAVGPYGYVTVAGDRTIGAPTNITRGTLYTLEITADATPRTITFDALFRDANDTPLGAQVIPATESRVWAFVGDGTQLIDVSHAASSSINSQPLTHGASVNWDLSLGEQGNLDINSGIDAAMATPSNISAGQFYILTVINSTASARQVSFAATYQEYDATVMSPDTLAPGDKRVFVFYSPDGATLSHIGGGGGASASTMMAATLIAAGATGLVPAPAAGDNTLFLRGDASWSGVAPDFATSTDYSAGSLVFVAVDPDGVAGLYRRISDGTSSAVDFATDVANWTKVASVSDQQEQFVVADITARDAIATATTGDIAYVIDASADTTVSAGAAVYVYDGTAWQKVSEFESLDEFSAATSSADGGTGTVPKPLANEHDLVLHGDATWREIAPAWTAATDYSAGAIVLADEGLWKRNTAGTSTAAFDATEKADWTLLATSKAMTGAAIAAIGEEGLVPAGAAGDEDKVLQGDGTWVEHDVIQVLNQIDFTASEPAAPTAGDRYIATATGNSSVTSQAMVIAHIYKWDGTTWLDVAPVEGQLAYDAAADSVLYFDGAAWVNVGALPKLQTLTDAASIAWDASLGEHAYVSISASRTLAAPTNLVAGKIYTLRVDSPGGDVLSFDTVFKQGNGAFAMDSVQLSTSQEMSFEFLCTDGTNLQELYRPAVATEDSASPAQNYGPGALVIDRDTGAMKLANTASSFLSVLEGTGFQANTRATYTDTAIASWNVSTGSLHLEWVESMDTDRVMTAVTGIDTSIGKPIVLEFRNTGSAAVSFTLPADFVDQDGAQVAPISVPAGEERFYVFLVQGAAGSRKLYQMFPLPESAMPSVVAWAATTAYKAGDIVITPSGALVQRAADGTSTGQYDATEAAAWNLVQNGAPLDGYAATMYVYADQVLFERGRLWKRASSGYTGATFDDTERLNWEMVSALDTVPVAEVSATTTAAIGELLPVDSSGGAVTINPPATPEPGDRFSVVDSRFSSSINNITLDFVTAGQNVHGLVNPAASANMVMNTPGALITCTYVDDVVGWIIGR